MGGRPAGYFDNRMQLRTEVCFHCKKCGKKVRKAKVLDTLAPDDETIRAALRPLLAVEAQRWQENNCMYCDACRPKTWRYDKWVKDGAK